MFRSIDWSIDRSFCPTGRMPWNILCLWGFLYVRDAGRKATKITGGLLHLFTVTIIRFSLHRPFKKGDFTGLCLFLKSQKYFLNISLFEGVTLQNVLVINELSSFRKVAAKLAKNKHSLQVLLLFTRWFVLFFTETMTKTIAISNSSLRY